MKNLLIFLASIFASACFAYPPLENQVDLDEMTQKITSHDWSYIENYVATGGDIFWADKYGNSLLAYLIAGHQNELALSLIEKGALTVVDDAGEFTDLFKQTFGGNLDFALVLLNRLESLKLPNQQELLNHLLARAIGLQEIDFIEPLIDKGADVNFFPDDGYSNLAQSLMVDETSELFRLLLEHGATLEMPGHQSGMLMFSAASTGNIEILRFLLENGISINSQSSQGLTALIGAVLSTKNTVEILALLFEQSADQCLKDRDGRTAYDFAEAEGKAELLESFPQLACSDQG